jgi:hypothetical protein
MATKVINTGRVPLQVGIILEDGTKSSIRVMGRGRPDLAEGVTVDPNWLVLHGGDVRVVEEKSIQVAEVATQIDNTKKETAPAATTATPSTVETPAATVTAKEDKQ